jgi:hypothetical protein
MTMSEAVRARSDSTSPEIVGALANTAAAAEMAVRAAAGAVGVSLVISIVRNHPVLSLLLATGVGYLLGKEWHLSQSQPAIADGSNSAG